MNGLTKFLSSKPPSSYSAATSELNRRLNFPTDRASVRRWAIKNQLAPDTRYKTPPKPVKRWQVRDTWALWQYDATPHAFLAKSPGKHVLLDLLDDATHYNTGARLDPSETLLAHFDFLPQTFQAHGLPLALYVDYHSFIFTHSRQTPKQNPPSSSIARSSKPVAASLARSLWACPLLFAHKIPLLKTTTTRKKTDCFR